MRTPPARFSTSVFTFLLLLTAGWSLPGSQSGVHAADSPTAAWRDYDQAADLATLAQHENERMQFQRLLSPIQDRAALWRPFEADLADFTAARLQQLSPLIVERSIPELQSAVGRGELSYADLTRFYLARSRVVENDPDRYLNALIALNPEAIRQARARDAERAAGRSVDEESLFGIPVLLKDNIGAAGMPTTAGALALRDNDSVDAFITARLREQGAIILGKANLSEWAYFFCENCPSGYSAMGGQTLNPYGRFEFGTGGSSSGSGAAVAANYAAATVGSETSGSILSPASANSAVGLKPTTGALSRSGVVPISSTLDTAGPITRTVHDAVILFNAMAGFDPADGAMSADSAELRLHYRLIDLSGWRLGARRQFLDEPLFQQALEVLSGAGAVVSEVDLPEVDTQGFEFLLGGDMVRDLALYLRTYGDDDIPIASIAGLQAFNAADRTVRAPYGQETVDMMVELALSEADLQSLRSRLQDSARAALDALFEAEQLDVLLSANNSGAGLAALANYPALTVPMGYDDAGRPQGLTLIAPGFSEQRLIDLGARFEQLTRARQGPPNYP